MKKSILKSPGGVRSYLPQVAYQLNEISRKIEKVFSLWGYQPVITPTIEYYNSLTTGMGLRLDTEIYKFIDYEGQILALRPEMTAPIARTVGSRLSDLSLPLRLSYNANVFRYDEPQSGKNREIYQRGVELIGEDNALADAEAVILAVEALQKTGLKDIKIDIGHVAYLDGIMEKLDLKDEEKNEIKSYLNKRDLVGLDDYVENLGIKNSEIILSLPALRGDYDTLIEAEKIALNSKSKEAVSNLKEVYKTVESYGFKEYINFDLSLIRGFDYYTGVVFEAFTEKLGYTICGGGRYNNLIQQYCSRKIPAIGFAIGIDRVRLALKKQNFDAESCSPEILLVLNREVKNKYLNIVKLLRDKGRSVIISENQEEDNYEELAKRHEINDIIIIDDIPEEKIKHISIKNKEKNYIKIKEGWEEELCRKL